MNKLTCKDACLLLSLYIDDMLSDEEMTQMRKHLETCDDCRNEYDLLKGIMYKGANLECPELSSTFASELHKKLLDEAEFIKIEEEEKPKAVPPVRRFRIYPYVAAGAAAIVISVLALGNLPDSDSFITENKNEVIESAIPYDAQEIKPDENALPAAETAVSATNEPLEESIETTEREAEVEQGILIEKPVALIEEESSEQNAEDDINEAIHARSMPMMAADIADEEEEVLTDGSDGISITEEASETMKAASGGGSLAAEEKTKISVVFSFNHEAVEEVRELMSGVTAKGSIYEVPVSNLPEYIDMLMSVDGYVSHRQLEEDFTKKYNLLEKNGDTNGMMAQIEEYTNYATIIIGS